MTTLGAGCTDRRLPTGTATAERREPLTASVGPQDLARAMAVALASAEVRADVRDAMRASPMTEHKLVLQEFVGTPAGDRLLRAAADASGLSREQLESVIAALPEMDFYAPFRQHRLSWKGTGDVLVAATLAEEGGRVVAYGIDGRETTLDLAGDAPVPPLLIMHPAERKGLRVAPQADRPGMVIQEPDDGEVSGVLVRRDAQGHVQEIPLAMLVSGRGFAAELTCENEALSLDCYDEGEGEGEGPDGGSYYYPSPGWTYLDFLQINYQDLGGSEITLTARYYSASGTVVATDDLYVEGLTANQTYYPHLPLIEQRILEGSAQKINVNVVEEDSWFTGGDDHMGNRDFFADDRGQVRSITPSPGNFSQTTNVELDWTPRT